MINSIFYDNKSLADFGLYISGHGTFNAPARRVSYVSVPGRNGNLTLDEGCYENTEVKYVSYIPEGMKLNTQGLRNFLMTKAGYRRLEDTYHPDEFRLGRYVQGLEVEPSQMHVAATFELTFDCKPQRYLKEGENPVEVTNGGILYNPEDMTALPLIRVYGAGSFNINGYAGLVDAATYTDIDCETQEAYMGTVSRNSGVTLTNGFPKLTPGDNAIALNGFSKVEITPRWWRL
jgi:phage-related protein